MDQPIHATILHTPYLQINHRLDIGFTIKNHNLKIPSTPTIIGLDWRVRGPL